MSYMSKNFDPKKHSIYKPINPEKYLGKDQIVCRSTWEHDICRFFDLNPKIVSWISEPSHIEYFDAGSGKKRRYFPDFLVKYKSGDKDNIALVEIKPFKETQPPKFSTRKNKVKYLNEQKVFATNISKWKAAKTFCMRKGWKFLILTEKEIYGR